MSSGDREDPRPMLAIFAALLGLAAWRFLSHLHPGEVLLSASSSLIPIALGATAIATALATQRLLATRRTLASRRALALVPADEFDPRPQAVASFAAQLAHGSRRIGGWADRPASAVRVCLTNDPAGRLVYLIEVPERDAGLLRSALRAYRGIELRDPADVLGERRWAERDRGGAVRSELVLARASAEPLARLPLNPDPLTGFAAALAGLRRDRGEVASVCVDLAPAAGRRATRLRRRLRRQARRGVRGSGAGQSFSEILAGGEGRAGGRSGPVDLYERRALGRSLEAKLGESETLFELQVLLRVACPERSRAKAVMAQLLAAFSPSAERNRLRVAGLPIPGLAFLGADLPVRRARLDRRVRTGLFRPARRDIITGAEVAGFLKPPTVNCEVDEVVRAGALVSPPPALETFEPERTDLMPIGRVAGESGGRLVGAPVTDSFFTYIAGRSRYGKTEAAITMFTHLVRSGYGGLFLDPHGDALARIRPYLTEAGVAERVIEIDLGPGAGSDGPAWNLFELRGEGAPARVEAIVDAFAAAMGWGEQSTRAINLTTQAASALAALSEVLPEELAPTIFQIPTLLADEGWREAALPFLPSAGQAFWRDRFPLLSGEAITPVTNLVDRLRASAATAALLGQSRGTFGVRKAMDEGLIVLACPGSGGTRERLVANLLAFDLLHSARSRAALDPTDRRPFVAVFDEVQSYDGESLAALLEQSAKFGLRAIFLNQNPERLRPATLDALTTNRSHLLASALNSHAASLITKEWGGEPSPASLTRLPRYRFLAQVTRRGELSRPFALAGVRVEDALGPGRPEGLGELEAAVGESGRLRPAAKALADLETLDDRIREELEARGGTGESGGDDALRMKGPE